MNEIKDQINKFEALLPVPQSISMPEAERRAGEFLVVMAKIADWKHLLGKEKIKLTSIQTAIYAEELSNGKAKTMTENKVTAEASTRYISSREALEEMDNDISYLKTYYEIFNNAHLFYRQMCKSDFQ